MPNHLHHGVDFNLLDVTTLMVVAGLFIAVFGRNMSRGLSARSDSKPEIRSMYLRTLILFGSRTGLPQRLKAEARRSGLTVTATDAPECYRGPPILQCRSLGNFPQAMASCG